MARFRFLHMADVHLDTPFASRIGEVRRRLREALLESFRAAVDLAVTEGLDAVLIAGDLFDRTDLSFATERFLLTELGRLREAAVPVFYASGNHDPGLTRSGIGRIEWPPNVTLFPAKVPKRCAVTSRHGEEIGFVTGAGHETAVEGENLAALFPPAPRGFPELALLHATVHGCRASEEHERYAPCGTGDLRSKGYHYWALGHIHARQEVWDDPPAHYPGSIVGRSRKESGEKGVLLVEMEDGSPAQVTFRETSPVVWNDWEVNIEGASSFEALRRLLAGELAARRSADRDALITLKLTGPSPLRSELAREESREELQEALAGEAGLLTVDIRTEGVAPSLDWERIRVGPIAELLDLVERLRDGTDSILELAPADLAGFDGEDPEKKERYLRSLLEGADVELAARMWREKE